MAEQYLIWWTSQEDCEAITPLDSWPMWLYDEFRSRNGRAGRGRLWVPPLFASDAPEEAKWSIDNWLCAAAEIKSAGGIVIPAHALRHIQFLPGFITTFEMSLPDAELLTQD